MQKLLLLCVASCFAITDVSASQLRITDKSLPHATNADQAFRLGRTMSHDRLLRINRADKKIFNTQLALYDAHARFKKELADIIRFQEYQDTRLRRAAYRGDDEEYIENLVKKYHARIDAPSAEGKTALHYAAEEGNTACVETLLKHQASLNLLDAQKFTPLMYAMVNQHHTITDILIAAGGQIQSNNLLFIQQIASMTAYNLSLKNIATTSDDEEEDIYLRYSPVSTSEEDEY